MKIIYALTLLFLLEIPLLHAECSKNTKCIKLSGETIPKDCSPKQSNDCNIKDATVVDEKEIVPLWQGLEIKVGELPPDSWYQVPSSNETEYHLIVYPNVGKHYLLGSHDFEVHIKITKTGDPSSEITCVANTQLDDFGEVKLRNGNFNILIQHELNYYYDGGPGGNPNPYTSEVKKILKALWGSIKIGKC